MINDSPSVLDCVTCTVGHTSLKDITWREQMPDMITDGSFVIRRSTLQLLAKSPIKALPGFIKDALLAPVRNQGPAFDNLFTYSPEYSVAVEVAPVLARLPKFVKAKGPANLMCRFDQVDGDMRVFANAHFAKLLIDLVPNGDWYANGELKPLLLVVHVDGEKQVVAAFMPIEVKHRTPGFSASYNHPAVKITKAD